MGKIFQSQTKLRIELTMGIDITGATSTQIKYRNPSGGTGSFDATIADALLGKIQYDIVSSLDIIGAWHLWAYAVLSDGKIVVGESVKMVVHNEGE